MSIEDFYHVEGQMLKYKEPPKDRREHHKWLDEIYNILDRFSKIDSPRLYTLVQLENKDPATQKTTPYKLTWRRNG